VQKAAAASDPDFPDLRPESRPALVAVDDEEGLH
jgi:hypothetical protein